MVAVHVNVPDRAALDAVVSDAVGAAAASRLAAQDPTLWGPAAVEEASIRLSWVGLHESSRPLVAEVEQLRADLAGRGVDRVVLCGMGGSSLAPEVICRAAGVPLVVLDSSQPDMVRDALETDLERTVVVVSSKSGGTVETDSQRRAYEQAFTDAGIDPAERIVVVTDPGSPLEQVARDAGYRLFSADPHVGGRYSALTAFGLVPSGLAGAPIGQLLDEAAAVAGELGTDDAGNAGLLLGSVLGQANRQGVDKLVLADRTGHGLGDWIEQLVAESTGKEGKGILPVVVPGEDAPNFSPATSDSLLVVIGGDEPPAGEWSAAVSGDLGGLMLAWEHATAHAGRLIGINPFDQPDVESAKQAARDLLGGGGETVAPDAHDAGIDLYGTDASSLGEALATLLGSVDGQHGYLAVQVYLDRLAHADFTAVRETLAERLGRPVTFGWGPRFLHSTGQYHKGGPATGVYLQVTGEPLRDLDVPGRDFTFGSFIGSQAAGDAKVLRDHGRPVLSLHLHDVEAGLARLREALG